MKYHRKLPQPPQEALLPIPRNKPHKIRVTARHTTEDQALSDKRLGGYVQE